MQLVERIVEKPRACSYLPSERASLEVEAMLAVTPEELESLLEHGWRRFGPIYFRPACTGCTQCESLRVLVNAFTPSKTQRRVLRDLSRFRRVVSVPTVDEARLDLYARWHAERESARHWDPNPTSRERYAMEFAFPHPSAREAAFYDDARGGRLVGVGLFDATPHALSATFFFHDPEYARASLGVVNVLTLLRDAKQAGRPHLYLGFHVAGCTSLRYKAGYRPHEVLDGRPGAREPAIWTRRAP